MSWWLAGLIAGVGAWLADYVMWSKVLPMKALEVFVTPPPAGQKMNMGPMMVKSLTLALVFGVLMSLYWTRWHAGLWVQGALGGLEFATMLWAATILMQGLGAGVWFDKLRPLFKADAWAWLVRINVAGVIIALLVK